MKTTSLKSSQELKAKQTLIIGILAGIFIFLSISFADSFTTRCVHRGYWNNSVTQRETFLQKKYANVMGNFTFYRIEQGGKVEFLSEDKDDDWCSRTIWKDLWEDIKK